MTPLKTLWSLQDLLRQVWVRVALYSVLAVASVGIAPLVSPLLPDGLTEQLGQDQTRELLSVLTNSMLVVATFSLSVMVTAHQFASSQVTPRSHRLLREDGRTQRVLATFIGAFVYAIVSRIVITVGLYESSDFAVVYGITSLVLLAVILALIRWVQQLAALGSMEKTTGRIEQATRAALEAMADKPYYGCTPLGPDDRPVGRELKAKAFGYVRYVDFQKLSEDAGDDGHIDILVQPGDWVGPGDAVLSVGGVDAPDEELLDDVVIGDLRSFDQDPIFGLQVLSEIGQRALSPGLNDPQTAVDIIRRMSRLLHLWNSAPVDEPLPGLRVRAHSAERAIHVALDHISRDGAGMVEVHMALQATLCRLTDHAEEDVRQAALRVSRRALERTDRALQLKSDREAVRRAAPPREGDAAAST